MNTDDVEPFITDGGKAVRCCRPDDHDVASAGSHLFPIDDHCRLTREHDTRFGIGMPVQSWAFPLYKVAQKKGDTGAVWLAFEFDCGGCAFPLISTMQDVEHSASSRMLELWLHPARRYA